MLREEHRLRVLENRGLRKISGHKEEEVTEENIIMMIYMICTVCHMFFLFFPSLWQK
jgi:hypothetical protein